MIFFLEIHEGGVCIELGLAFGVWRRVVEREREITGISFFFKPTHIITIGYILVRTGSIIRTVIPSTCT